MGTIVGARIRYAHNISLSDTNLRCQPPSGCHILCLTESRSGKRGGDIAMSLRWRRTGELLCAAKSEPMELDTYIDDRLHYELSVIQKAIVPSLDEEETGRWYWLHGEHGVFIRAEEGTTH